MSDRPSWVSDEDLAALTSAPPASTMSKNTAEKIAMEIFRDNLPLAAQVIADIAVNSPSERNQLAASKYIVERVMGRTPDAKSDETRNEPWSDLFSSVIREPTLEERQAGQRVSRI